MTDFDRSSVLRVPTIIKKSIIGCQSGRYKAATVNVVWSKIHSDLGQVVEDMLPGSYAISPGKVSNVKICSFCFFRVLFSAKVNLWH